MQTRSQKVQFYFHRSAIDFDRLYNKTGLFNSIFNVIFRKALYKRTDETIKELKIADIKSVLDVGCGSGVNSIQFVYNGVERVTGIDYADGMIKLAREQTPPDVLKKVDYVAADFLQWMSEKKYGAVVALGVFDYLDNPRSFLDKMYDIALKKVILSVPGKGNLRQYVRKFRYNLKNCPLYFYSKSDLAKLLSYDDSTFEIRGIGSSGYLCIINKSISAEILSRK